MPEERIREELRVMRVREVEHRRRLLVMEAKEPMGALACPRPAGLEILPTNLFPMS